MGFLGKIVNWIISPIANWFSGLLYDLFVRGPLRILSYASNAFSYLSGSEVDKLLFNTSIINGKPELNFFASDSPLKTLL